MGFPTRTGKTTIEQLSDIITSPLPDNGEVSMSEARLYVQKLNDFKFDFLWKPNFDSKRLFVFFSGDAIRSKNNPPVFQRWSWASFLPGHCLYVSDPSLYLDDQLGLAWYAGTEAYDPMLNIVSVVIQIRDYLGISKDEVYSYGSSGGGFAALRMAAMMERSGVIAVNPQTVVTEYSGELTEKYLNVCFGGRDRTSAINEFSNRLSILSHIDILKNRKIIYIQNKLDKHHYEKHYKPFCEAIGEKINNNESSGLFRRIIFSHEGGHTKAETEEVFGLAMNIVKEWSE